MNVEGGFLNSPLNFDSFLELDLICQSTLQAFICQEYQGGLILLQVQGNADPSHKLWLLSYLVRTGPYPHLSESFPTTIGHFPSSPPFYLLYSKMVLQDFGRRITGALSDLTRSANLDEQVRLHPSLNLFGLMTNLVVLIIGIR